MRQFFYWANFSRKPLENEKDWPSGSNNCSVKQAMVAKNVRIHYCLRQKECYFLAIWLPLEMNHKHNHEIFSVVVVIIAVTIGILLSGNF